MELNMSYWLQFIVEVVSKGHIQHYLQIGFVIIMEEMEDIWSFIGGIVKDATERNQYRASFTNHKQVVRGIPIEWMM